MKQTAQKLKWEQISNEDIGYCVKRIISDGLKLSKKLLKSALETFSDIIVIEDDE